MSPTAGIDELLALATATATEAANLLSGSLARARATIATKSTATDMVSVMDTAAETLIRDRLLDARPGDGFLGEESAETHGHSGLRWVVDPLDGTTNSLYYHPGWNVSIAAEDGDGAVVGVVVIPTLADTFTAARGQGARRNGVPVGCSTKEDLATALCATGFSYAPDRRRRQADVLAAVLPLVRDVRRLGAAAGDLCSVACGRVDAYWERGLGPWDLAAGVLVATEAGAVVETRPSGLVIAGPPALFVALRSLLVDSGADGA